MSPKCLHPEWEHIAESRYSSNDWCKKCGAWKRIDLETGETTVNVPQGVKK